MASTYFTNSDLTMIETLLSTLAEEAFPHGSDEHREIVHFLIGEFQDGHTADRELRYQLSRHRARRNAMSLSLAEWSNEGGAVPVLGLRVRAEFSLAQKAARRPAEAMAYSTGKRERFFAPSDLRQKQEREI